MKIDKRIILSNFEYIYLHIKNKTNIFVFVKEIKSF